MVRMANNNPSEIVLDEEKVFKDQDEEEINRKLREHLGDAVWETAHRFFEKEKIRGEAASRLEYMKPTVGEEVMAEMRDKFKQERWTVENHFYYTEMDSLQVHPNQELVTLLFKKPIDLKTRIEKSVEARGRNH